MHLQSYGITNKFLNPIMGVDLAQFMYSPYVVRWVGLAQSFLKMSDSYVTLMLLKLDLLTFFLDVGLKYPPFINPICG